MADQSDTGTAGPGAASAHVGSVRWGLGGSSGLPPKSLVFLEISSGLFKLGRRSGDGEAPGVPVCSEVGPDLVVDMAL